MLLIMMGVIDFGRLYTTVISVESAAREAADYGTTYGAARWSADNLVDTERRMEERACVAASALADYVDADSLPGSGCQNPSFSYCVTPEDGEPCVALDPADVCEDPARPTPCAVTVTLTYQFHLLVPFNIEMLGTQLGACRRRSASSVTAPLRSRISRPRCRRSLRCRHPRRHRRRQPNRRWSRRPNRPWSRHRDARTNEEPRPGDGRVRPGRPAVLPRPLRDHRGGRFMFYYETLNNATREGARYAIVNGANTSAARLDRRPRAARPVTRPGTTLSIASVHRAFGIPPSTSTVMGRPSDPPTMAAEKRERPGAYTYSALVPIVPLPPITVSAESSLVINNCTDRRAGPGPRPVRGWDRSSC